MAASYQHCATTHRSAPEDVICMRTPAYSLKIASGELPLFFLFVRRQDERTHESILMVLSVSVAITAGHHATFKTLRATAFKQS